VGFRSSETKSAPDGAANTERGAYHSQQRRVRSGAQGVTYQVQVRLAGHRPVTKSFSTRSAAKSWARDLECKLARSDPADSEAERRTLADACDQYLKTHPDIAGDHTRIVNWWNDTHGRRKLSRVTTPWLTEVRDDLAAGHYLVGPKGQQTKRKRQPGTVNRSMTYLRTVVSYCVEIGWMSPRRPDSTNLAVALKLGAGQTGHKCAVTAAGSAATMAA